MKKENRLYSCHIPIVGITGGIGTGKSSVANFFFEKKQLVIDADAIVKEIYQKSSTIDWLQVNLPEVVNENREIDFEIFRKVFFSNQETKKMIESFIYPQMESIFTSKISSQAQMIFYDVPLLFEKKINLKVDKSLVVSCDKEIQIQRVCKRDRISRELAENIISQQMSLEEKVKLCDYHINNSLSLKELKSNSYQILEKIQKDIL